VIQRQAKSEAEEASESYDSLASITSEYYGLRQELVRVEAEVYEFGRILQQMQPARANKFKGTLWRAWYTLQTVLK